MRLKDLTLVFTVLAFLFLAELALEVRADLRGFNTLLVGQLRLGEEEEAGGDAVPGEVRQRWGPAEGFPFASLVVTPTEVDGPVVWVASSSYALGGRTSFPRFFEDSLRAAGWPGATVLTEATPGRTVGENVDMLLEHGPAWSPAVAVLYQLTNDLHMLAALDSAPTATGAEAPPTPRSWGNELRRLYENTAVYAQLTNNFTPFFSQHQLTPQQLPPWADSLYARDVRSFVGAAREVGATPLLATLATSPRAGEPPSRDARFFMLRWNPYYRPDAYLRTVRSWNDIVRGIGAEMAVPVLDTDAMLSGRPSLYRDLVHFTEEGMDELGTALARSTDQLLGGAPRAP